MLIEGEISGKAQQVLNLTNRIEFNLRFNGKVIDDKGIWPFKGESKLHHVYYGGEYYIIEFLDNKPVLLKENNK